MFITSALGSRAPGAVIDLFGADLDSDPGTAHRRDAGADWGSRSSISFNALYSASVTPIAEASLSIAARSKPSSVGDFQKSPFERAENGDVITFHQPRLRLGVGRVDWRFRALLLKPEKLLADVGGCSCSSSSKTVQTDKVAL